MSLHADLSPDAVARLSAQQRNSTISSLVIAILVVVLIGVLLGIVLLPVLVKDTPTIVTYESNLRQKDRIQEKKVQTQVERKPSSPSSSMAKVIAANTVSDMTIPVPEVDALTPSMDFGDGDDFGNGWGNGSGGGGRGGGASFFQQEVKAERVAYVIDFSLSMLGQRAKLMRAELGKSVSKLPASMQYQMIFFAGPAWIAGSEVKMADNRKSAAITGDGTTFDWISNGSTHGWEPKGRAQRPEWLMAESDGVRKSLGIIKDTPLEWGTQWSTALDMALKMDPPPQVIFFMTDGVTGGDLKDTIRRITGRAKTHDTRINAIAMMEPKAHDAMKGLAKGTGGMFTIIEKDGSVRKVPLD